MALGLGLHREPPSGTKTDSFFQERRRVIWSIVYCFDSGFGITTGRPVLASDSFIETRLPRNIDDSVRRHASAPPPNHIEKNNCLPSLQACTTESDLPEPLNQPTTYSAIIAQARLASIGNNIYCNVVSVPKDSVLDLRTSRSLDYQLKAWRLSLPVYFTAQDVPDWFRGPRAVVGWKEQNLRMMLWWGSQRLCGIPSDIEEARNMCNFAATEAIQDITTFCADYGNNMHVGLSWYATYFLFQATLVLSIHYLGPYQQMDMSPGVLNQELGTISISRARDCLAQISQSNAAAARCLAVLERIRDQSQQPQHFYTPPSVERPNTAFNASQAQTQPVMETVDTNTASFAVDPALQILLQDSEWNNDIFEGLQGFPITDEIETFDYMLPNVFASDATQE